MAYKTKAGLSFIETVVYMAIFSLIVVVIANTVSVALGAYGDARVRRVINTEGSFALSRLMYELRLAQSVDAAGSSFGTSSGRLRLQTIKSSSDETPVTREFFAENGVLFVKEGAALPVPLTAKAYVTRLAFYHLASSTVSQAVRVELSVEGGAGRSYTEESFHSSAVLRGSYGQ